jgi:formate dehydrogenase major subunit
VHNAEFPNHLNNGRLLEHFEQGSMTYRTEGIKRMTPMNFVEVSPEEAESRGMETGTIVHLRSPAGDATVPVLVTDRVDGTQLYMPLNSVKQPVNRLTGALVDRATHTPAYKETSVQMTIVEKTGPSPLPAENFRNGKRTPQSGVEIERKWKRADYHVPGESAGDKLVQIKTTAV